MQYAAHESSLSDVGLPPPLSAVCGVIGRVEGVWVVGLGDAGLDDIWVIGNAVGNANVAIDIFFPSVCSAGPEKPGARSSEAQGGGATGGVSRGGGVRAERYHVREDV